MSRQDQKQKIHMLKDKAGLTDDDYRTLLGSMFQGVCSSVDLSESEADRLIAQLRSLAPGFAAAYSGGRRKYVEIGKRPGMASPAQLRMLEAMWAEVSIHHDAKGRALAFKDFLSSRFNVQDILWLQHSDVNRVVVALKAMRRQALAAAAKKMLGGKA